MKDDLRHNPKELKRTSPALIQLKHLFALIAANDVTAVRNMFEEFHLDPNSKFGDEYAIEKAFYASPQMLVVLLEAGASTRLPPHAPLQEQTTLLPLCTASEAKVKADILMIAGAKLTEKDTQQLALVKQAKGYKPSAKFYIEEVAAGTCKPPTLRSLKGKYHPGENGAKHYISMDLDKRAASLSALEPGEPSPQPSTPELPVIIQPQPVHRGRVHAPTLHRGRGGAPSHAG